ncbi:MAG: acyl-[acyl-carrier-protein] thioesterase [Eubacteriales bacterium]
MFYQGIYTPRPSDYDRYGKISYEAILQILEAAAGDHSASVGDGISDANKNGKAWILTEWRVKILRHPEYGENLIVSTWVCAKASAGSVFRVFALYDGNNRETVRAEAKYALLDLQTLKPMRISGDLLASYQPEEKRMFEDLPRLRPLSGYSVETVIKLRRNDIDFNGHVHNTRYVQLAAEVLPKEVFEREDFVDIRMIYSKPLKADDAVCLKYSESNAEHLVGIYNQEGLCCLVDFKPTVEQNPTEHIERRDSEKAHWRKTGMTD